MKTLASIWAREPAVLTGAVASILAVAIVFGVHVTDAQTHAVLAAIVGVSPLIAMFVVRSQVIPSSGATGSLPAPPSAQPSVVAAPKVPPLVALLALALVASGCTPTEQTIAKDATGVVCELVIQDVEPGLSNLPVCTTVEEIEQAIADWLSTHAAANLASGQLSAHEKYLAVRAYQAKHGAKK